MATDPDSQTFDCIIVGAGVAGCVLASRISTSRPDLRILLVEAGVEKDDRTSGAMAFTGGFDSDIEWNYRSVPQERKFGGDTVCLTSGKIVGGGSAVNYQVFTRGPAVDYNQWADIVRDERWSWDALLPYFKKVETWFPSAEMMDRGIVPSESHGSSGPIKVSHATNSGKPRNYPLREKTRRFLELLGHRQASDINAGSPLGYSEAFNSTYGGLRSFANSYPLGSNVILWTKSTVENVIMKGKTAEGVIISRSTGDGSERVRVEAGREVILAAGAHGSAKILLLSGIGPAVELDRHNIKPVEELPVGRNYVDHPHIFTYWTVTDDTATMGDGEMQASEVDWLAGLPYDWISFAPADGETLELARKLLSPTDFARYSARGKMQVESFIVYATVDTSARKQLLQGWPGRRVISLMHILVDPVSRGTLTLRSSDPMDPPVLDPKVLASPIDRSALYKSVQASAQAIQAVDGLNAVEFGIDDAIRDDWSNESIDIRANRSGGTVFHTSGTCAMGEVVDTECRVFGIDGLRVVDSGVIPIPLAAHYQAPTYGIAERAADMILSSLA
ncbi:glucose dehydrogenase [Aspergillus heteromorphus CBS 117.55]|uniref:Glucose dehydrogenase n=1 Tax=Aspergillus heteromorphus CBS 117.55 TaxID=1448321 RepID=A0A317WE74_9EURO|nr:glucose dehydrogenase [Aspergillus heteromorphus CBS 117.55]PWY84786.1 glucose dehydrogenase [Aspergillus heteromorphus CBS 117.55]